MSAYLQQQGYWNMVMEMPANDMSVNDMAGGFDPNYYYDSDPAYDITEDYCVSWPVYPSLEIQ